jgi:hypothetical protein
MVTRNEKERSLEEQEMMKRVAELFFILVLLTSLGSFIFWCGYKVGGFEKEWGKNQDIKVVIPFNEVGQLVSNPEVHSDA